MEVKYFRGNVGVIRLKCGDISYAGAVRGYAEYIKTEAEDTGELLIEFNDPLEIQSMINILEKLYASILHNIETEYKRGYKGKTK